MLRKGGGYMNLKMKSKRALLGLSQEELAKIVKVSRQTIILIEKDKYNPSLKLCVAISKALNTTLDDLFWEDAHE
jgi:putative transcriptional regulator